LLFEEVYPGLGYVPLAHAANLPHRVMSFNVETAEQRWRDAEHPLFDFVVRTEHDDIDVGSTSAWNGQLARNKVQLASTFPEKVAVKYL
jgi:hypothetical protein